MKYPSPATRDAVLNLHQVLLGPYLCVSAPDVKFLRVHNVLRAGVLKSSPKLKLIGYVSNWCLGVHNTDCAVRL